MDITTLLLLAGLVIALILFFPDLFPYCACCKKIKPRSSFELIRVIRISFGYKAHRSICKKCSRKYDISSIKEYERLEGIRTRIKRNIRM